MLDRIEVGRVPRKEHELGATRLDEVADAHGLVEPEIVEHDDVAGLQLGSETLLEVRVESPRVHRAVEHHRRDDAVERQARGDGDAVAPVLRNRIAGAIADRRPRTPSSSRG
jgi:hypothetical protein